MVKKIFLFFLILSSITCSKNTKITEPIVIYTDNGIYNTPFAIIEETFWSFKNEGGLDSLSINKKQSIEKLHLILNNVEKQPYSNQPYFILDYGHAIPIKYNKINDTLYLDEDLKQGFLIQNKINVFDRDNLLFNFIQKQKNQQS